VFFAMTNKFKKTNIPSFGMISNFTEIFLGLPITFAAWRCGEFSVPSHYKYNKTFHSAADFP
jgi:hypothetical protein